MKLTLSVVASLLLLVTCAFATPPSPTMFDKLNDFDGDGKADLVITRAEGGFLIWYIWQTTQGYRRQHWGLGGDFPVAGGLRRRW